MQSPAGDSITGSADRETTSVHPPPLTPTLDHKQGGRYGDKSTSPRRQPATEADVRAAIRLTSRVRAITVGETRTAIDRAVARSMRRSMTHIVHDRLRELTQGTEVYELWSRCARHLPSCEYVKALFNGLAGTLLGYPFSCRVPGCPYCESARIGQLRKRHWPAIRNARHPKAVTLTMRNVAPGQLRAAWRAIGQAFGRLRRSPLFQGGRCRPGKVGCLARIDALGRQRRRKCSGRCLKSSAREGAACHAACRPCRGHRPIVAALLAFEATVGGDGATWHPHANLLFDGPFVLKSFLDAAWARALGVDTAHTWIRDARRAPPGHHGQWTLEHALWETVKYAVKPDKQLIDSSRPQWFIEWVEARHRLRLVRSYGAWFSAPVVDEVNDRDFETLVRVTDPDSGRVYVAPLLDPLTDEEADWSVQPADNARGRFARYQPPGDGRKSWLVSHATLPVGRSDGR